MPRVRVEPARTPVGDPSERCDGNQVGYRCDGKPAGPIQRALPAEARLATPRPRPPQTRPAQYSVRSQRTPDSRSRAPTNPPSLSVSNDAGPDWSHTQS